MNNDAVRQANGLGLSKLLQWAARQELRDIPVQARKKTVMIMADDLAAMLSAENEPQVRAFHAQLSRTGPCGAASLLRRDRPRLGSLQAAIGNAVSGSWNELDEGYRKAVCHAGLYSLPVLLAVAESEDLPIAEVIRASTLAYEVTARFARSWPFEALKIHPHALFNALGAAAAIGFLRRLPADLMLNALTNASTLGVVGPFSQAVRGALIRNAWAAAGISNGFLAIDLAQAGICGLAETPHDVYVEMLGAQADPDQLSAELGQDWAVTSGYHKINACCQYAHSAIEAVQNLLQQQPQLIGGEGVERIEVQTHRLGMPLNDQQPVTTLGAKFSLPHAIAAALVYGHGGAEAFSTEAVADLRVAALRDRVDMRLVAQELAWPNDRPAFISLVGVDGRSYIASCMSARGGPERPFTDEELWTKIQTLSQASAPGLVASMRQLQSDCAGDHDPAGLSRTWRAQMDLFFIPAVFSGKP